LTTKIHATCDALDPPIRFHRTPGQAHDLEGAETLMHALKAQPIIADKAYDADARVITPRQQAGKNIVIPPKSNRKRPYDDDKDVSKTQHTRYDKRSRHFLAAISLAAAVIWLN
jgi:transposase